MVAQQLVTAKAKGRQILIQCDVTFQRLEELIGRLPHGKWIKSLRLWTCDLTPATAWRICNAVDLQIQACDVIRQTAAAFALGLAPAETRQPSRRNPGIELWDHQAKGFSFADQRGGALFDYWMGCVSCDTEYLSPTGWRRIDQYDGGQVGQYEPASGEVTFVAPSAYIALPCKEMIHFKRTRGMDQMLSEEHRVLWIDDQTGLHRVSSAAEVEQCVNGTQNARFPSAFSLPGGTPIGLTEPELRLQVAVMADGHFPDKSGSRRCIMRLKKRRKVVGIRRLLEAAKIRWSEEACQPEGFIRFAFEAPLATKVYDQRFWESTYAERAAICDECPNWDGSQRKSGAVDFFTTVRENADFIQFAFSSTGRRAGICVQDRRGQTSNGGEYIRKSIEYAVHAVGTGRSGNLISFAIRKQPSNARRVPTLDGKKYCFEVPTSFLVYRRNGCVFASGNTGKSSMAVHLVAEKRAKRTLILCPVAVRGVWRREFRKWYAGEIDVCVLDQKSWTVARKTKEAARQAELAEGNGHPFVCVINYESAWRPEFEKWALSQEWDVVICDESHKIGAPNTKASKFAAKLQAKNRYCLSGTPLSHSPLSVFGQARFIDPGLFGTSYARFRDRYAIAGPLGADHIVGFKNLPELTAVMDLFTIKAGKDVLKNMPPLTHEHIDGELERDARRLYDELEQECFAEVATGVITPANALVKLLRLQQITSGFVTVDETDAETGARTGESHVQITGGEKQELLTELLEGLPPGEPVVVFCKFTEDLKRIRGVAANMGLRYGEVSGQQRDLTPDGTYPPDVDILGVQIQSGGTGVDLTRACYCVYYSVGYSLSDYLQSLERCHRPGQTRATFFYHLILAKTVDEVVYRALRKRRSLIDEVMGYLKGDAALDPSDALLS